MKEVIRNEQGQVLVVVTREGDLQGMLGWAQPKLPGWMTTTVRVGNLAIQLLDVDFRLPSIGADRVLL